MGVKRTHADGRQEMKEKRFRCFGEEDGEGLLSDKGSKDIERVA